MKKVLWVLGGLLGLFVLANVIASGFMVFDYQLECTRCLREYHVVEKSFCGIVYSKTETLVSPGQDMTAITGSPCQHIFRMGGFGRQTYVLNGGVMGDGITSDGILFRFRWQTLRASFDLYRRFPNKSLIEETIAFIDTCLPPDATMNTVTEKQQTKSAYLFRLADSLEKVNSEKEWAKALEETKAEIALDEAAAK